MDEDKPKTDKKQEDSNGIVAVLKFLGLGLAKLDFIRAIVFKFGGRKVGLVALAIYGIIRVVEFVGDGFTTGHGLACLGIGIAAAGGALAIAWEAIKKGGQNETVPATTSSAARSPDSAGG